MMVILMLEWVGFWVGGSEWYRDVASNEMALCGWLLVQVEDLQQLMMKVEPLAYKSE
jgi:hypothetical protein